MAVRRRTPRSSAIENSDVMITLVRRYGDRMRLRLGEALVSNLAKCDGCRSSEPLWQEEVRDVVSNLIET
jgi:hypothetical protein